MRLMPSLLSQPRWSPIPLSSSSRHGTAGVFIKMPLYQGFHVLHPRLEVFVGLELRREICSLLLVVESSLLYFTRLGHMVLTIVFHATLIVRS